MTEKGINLIEKHFHLNQFDHLPENEAMVARLKEAYAGERKIVGADAIFYTHEIAEAKIMSKGMVYRDAHEVAVNKYKISSYSIYHPDVIQKMPIWFNYKWFDFWGIK